MSEASAFRFENSPLEVPAKARVARLIESAIFFVLLTIIALVAVPYGTNQPWSKALFDCGVLALTGSWIVEGLLSGSWSRPAHRLLVPGFALVLYVFLQTLPVSRATIGGGWWPVSFDPQSTRLVAMNLLAYVLTLGLLLRYTDSPRRLRILTWLVIGIALVSALFGMIRQTTQHEAGFLLPGLMPGLGYGQFINPNHFALLMEMGLGLLLGLVVAGGVRREQKLVYLAITLPLWAALVLSNSRGGILSMFSQLPFLILIFSLEPRGRDATEKPSWLLRTVSSWVVRAAIVFALLLGLVFSMFWLGGERLVSKIAQSDELAAAAPGGHDGARRLEIWRSTWQVIKVNPISGVGFGAYWVAIDEFNDRSGKLKPYAAHNDYLDLLASGGLIAFALAGWFIFLVVVRARAQLFTSDPFRRAACVGALVGLFGAAVHSLVDFGLQITVNGVIFVVLIAIATAEIEDAEMNSEAPARVVSGD